MVLVASGRRRSSQGGPPAPLPSVPAGRFRKDPQRWAATPAFRLKLHHELNTKLRAIEAEFDASTLNREDGPAEGPLGLIVGGVVAPAVDEVLDQLGVPLPTLRIGTPYPLPRKRVQDFVRRFDRVLVIEEPDARIELQIPDRTRVSGRLDGTVDLDLLVGPLDREALVLGLERHEGRAGRDGKVREDGSVAAGLQGQLAGVTLALELKGGLAGAGFGGKLDRPCVAVESDLDIVRPHVLRRHLAVGA